MLTFLIYHSVKLFSHRHRHVERSVVTPAGTARAEDPLGPMVFLTKLAEAVPAASIRR